MTVATKEMDILITGVGGQGVILASDVICETAIGAGFDVKKTDTLGMAQRGGSVTSHIRIGEKVWSPIIREGDVDLMLSFEKLEAARWGHTLHKGSVVIVNDYMQPPTSCSLGQEKYPGHEEIAAALTRVTDQVYFVDANARARELGNVRTLNIFMLGCFSVFAPISVVDWKQSITQRLPDRLVEINLKAFDLGRKEIEGVRI